MGQFYRFDALVPPNGVESVTVGQFTLREVAGSGAPYCKGVTLSNNSAYGANEAVGAGHSVSSLGAAGASVTVAPGDTANNLFSAYLVNGSSLVNGNISDGELNTGGGGCLTTGFIQGL